MFSEISEISSFFFCVLIDVQYFPAVQPRTDFPCLSSSSVPPKFQNPCPQLSARLVEVGERTLPFRMTVALQSDQDFGRMVSEVEVLRATNATAGVVPNARLALGLRRASAWATLALIIAAALMVLPDLERGEVLWATSVRPNATGDSAPPDLSRRSADLTHAPCLGLPLPLIREEGGRQTLRISAGVWRRVVRRELCGPER